MADDVKPKTPTAAETITALKQKANAWCEKYSGKPNHNPYLRIAQLIQPIIIELSVKDATVTPQIAAKIAALPEESPVIDPNWVAPVPVKSLPVATSATVGERNARQ